MEQTIGHVDDVTAYKANHQAFCGELSPPEVIQYYNKWAESGEYDMHLNPERYTGPESAARGLADCFPDEEQRLTANVLDVAAGTGRLGAELYRLGFRKLTALDPSDGMLSRAKQLGVYTEFLPRFIGIDNPVPCEDSTYDGLTCSGGFGEGHIPSSALFEMIRIVKPGGYIIIAMREEYIDQVEDYKNNLRTLLSNMELDGRWKIVSKDVIPNYAFCKDGVLFKFMVL